MKKYDVLFFDLFDTVINFSFTNLPLIELSGVRARTTSKEVYEVFRRLHPDVPFPEFYDHFISSYREFQDLKLAENREYPNRDRFLMMLSDMDLAGGGDTPELADDMVKAHMNGLASAVSFPPENESALSALRDAKYRMAIVSNFDYAPTAYSLIEKFGLMRFFEKVIISEEVGWRKPSPVIFEDALKRLYSRMPLKPWAPIQARRSLRAIIFTPTSPGRRTPAWIPSGLTAGTKASRDSIPSPIT